MFRINKKCIQAGAKTYQKIGKLPHTRVHNGGTWMCSLCGISFKKASQHGVVVVGARASCMGTNKIRAATHDSHCIHTADVEGGVRILFCSLCGAYGAHKAVRLKERSQPQNKAKGLA